MLENLGYGSEIFSQISFFDDLISGIMACDGSSCRTGCKTSCEPSCTSCSTGCNGGPGGPLPPPKD